MTATLLVALRPDGTVISPDRDRVVTFDREGRLFTYFRRGLTYRRDLASRLYVRGKAPGSPDIRWWRPVAGDEARSVVEEAYGLAAQARSGAADELARRLDDEILRWTWDDLARQAEAYRAAYPYPPSILPPDRYLSIVLQATFGCTWNRCTFCALYRDRPFRARDAAEFEEHAWAVRALLGRQWPYRQGLFLGDGNALALSLERLEPLVRAGPRVLPGHAPPLPRSHRSRSALLVGALPAVSAVALPPGAVPGRRQRPGPVAGAAGAAGPGGAPGLPRPGPVRLRGPLHRAEVGSVQVA